MDRATDFFVLWRELVQIFHLLVVGHEHHGVDRILEVLGHQLFLDMRAALVDEVEGHLMRGLVVELGRLLLLIDEEIGADQALEVASVLKHHVH